MNNALCFSEKGTQTKAPRSKRHNRKQTCSEIEKEISETLFIQKNRSVLWPGNFLEDCLSQYRVDCASEDCLSHRSQCPDEMCLSLEHQKPVKTSEKIGYFDRVTVSLHGRYFMYGDIYCTDFPCISYTFPFLLGTLLPSYSVTLLLRARISVSCLGRPSGDVLCASEAMVCGY